MNKDLPNVFLGVFILTGMLVIDYAFGLCFAGLFSLSYQLSLFHWFWLHVTGMIIFVGIIYLSLKIAGGMRND